MKSFASFADLDQCLQSASIHISLLPHSVSRDEPQSAEAVPRFFMVQPDVPTARTLQFATDSPAFWTGAVHIYRTYAQHVGTFGKAAPRHSPAVTPIPNTFAGGFTHPVPVMTVDHVDMMESLRSNARASEPAHTTKDRPCSVVHLQTMPSEVLFAILSYLDVDDLISASRTSHHLRHLSLDPILHVYRLRQIRAVLPPLLQSRSSMDELIARSIFVTHTSVVSRRLGRSLVSIRLARRLAARPSPQELVNRAVLLPECIPGKAKFHVAPALVAKRRAIEKEQVKDGLRH